MGNHKEYIMQIKVGDRVRLKPYAYTRLTAPIGWFVPNFREWYERVERGDNAVTKVSNNDTYITISGESVPKRFVDYVIEDAGSQAFKGNSMKIEVGDRVQLVSYEKAQQTLPLLATDRKFAEEFKGVAGTAALVSDVSMAGVWRSIKVEGLWVPLEAIDYVVKQNPVVYLQRVDGEWVEPPSLENHAVEDDSIFDLSNSRYMFARLFKEQDKLRGSFKKMFEKELENSMNTKDWRPEPGETILLGPDEIPLEFITMTKDGTWFVCHAEDPSSVAFSDTAKPKPKEWYELVSAKNPALCWVWDDGENRFTTPRVVTVYDDDERYGGPFVSTHWVAYKHAKFIAWVKDVK
jgi:hypothetical protein